MTFSKSELTSYTDRREVGLSRKTTNWLRKAAQILWTCTKGEISKTTVDVLRQYVLRKYVDVYAKRKVINFTRAFFRYLARTRFDTRYQAFELFLEMPKTLQERKHVTSRIVTKHDIEDILAAIEQAAEKEEIDECHRLNYRAIVLFGAFSGQRPLATLALLTVGQFKRTLGQHKPVLDIRKVTKSGCSTTARSTLRSSMLSPRCWTVERTMSIFLSNYLLNGGCGNARYYFRTAVSVL